MAKEIKISSRTWVFVLMAIIIWIYAWPFFTGNFGGYMHTYEFGKEYKSLWQWLSNDQEDYRILWLPSPYPTLYSGLDRAGYDPMAAHAGKPTLYKANYHSPQFILFLVKLLYERRTEYLGKLLGISNVKYIVFDPNKRTTSTDNHWVDIYFPEMKFTNEKLIKTLEQEEAIRPYDKFGSIEVFENRDFMPHIFHLARAGLVAGDLDMLLSMSYTEDMGLDSLGLIFSNQVSLGDLKSIVKGKNISIIVENGRFLDLVLSAVPKKYTVEPIAFFTSKNPGKGWAPYFWFWHELYCQAQLERLVFTLTKTTLNIPYRVEQSAEYHICLKVFYSPRASSLKIYLDDKELGTVHTKTTGGSGFKWVHFPTLNLENGEHNISIKSEKGENILAQLVVVPSAVMGEALETTDQLIRNKPLILVSELEKPLSCEGGRYSESGVHASHGAALCSCNYKEIKCNLDIPRDGYYKVYLRGWSNVSGYSLKAELNESEFEVQLGPLATGSLWRGVGEVSLPKGNSTLSFKLSGEEDVYLDQLLLVDAHAPSLRSPQGTNLIYKKVNPTRYLISAQSSEPFCLFFSEAYHRQWKIRFEDGRSGESYPGYSFGNLFFIDKTGDLKMTLEFDRQRYVDLGRQISLYTLVFLLILMLVPKDLFRAAFK